jgi:hypothetical protein
MIKVNCRNQSRRSIKPWKNPEEAYPGRKFTPDGHLVGSIGEVVAPEALGLTLYVGSRPGHDAYVRTVTFKLR